MDWKSTAVISGAGILATWFFSMPASQPPQSGAVAPAARAPQGTASASIDIQREAARLQVRIHPDPSYVESSRNPFRFAARSAGAARPVGTSAPVQPSTAPVPVLVLEPPPPRLDGIATDMEGDQPKRTAMMNTDAGVVLAREGDQVGQFRVSKIAADAVELVKISDGSLLRLALR